MSSFIPAGVPPEPRSSRPAIFLDRDGTLNIQVVREGKPFPPSALKEFRLFHDAAAACRILHDAGYILVVVTNQPDVGRGTQSQAIVEAMHARLIEWIPQISHIEACYDPGQGIPSRRRKPEPGMILDAATALNLDLSQSWMVGDRWRDIDCGRRAGLRTVFIDFGYTEELRAKPDYIVKSISAAAAAILSNK